MDFLQRDCQSEMRSGWEAAPAPIGNDWQAAPEQFGDLSRAAELVDDFACGEELFHSSLIFTLNEHYKVQKSQIAHSDEICQKRHMGHDFFAVDKAGMGRRLTLLRLALGLNQREMAEKFNCAPPRWNSYEKGRTPIQIQEAIQLAQSYGVSLDWLYRGDPAMMPLHLIEKIDQIEEMEKSGQAIPVKRRKLG